MSAGEKITLILMDGEELTTTPPDGPEKVPDRIELIVLGARRLFVKEGDRTWGERLRPEDLEAEERVREYLDLRSTNYAKRKAAAEGVPSISADDL